MVAQARRQRRLEQQRRLKEERDSINRSWIAFRHRLRKMFGPAVESRLVFLDQRWYEIRSCGWNPEDSDIWNWWMHLDWPIRVRLILMSKRCGMYAQSRKLWKKTHISLN